MDNLIVIIAGLEGSLRELELAVLELTKKFNEVMEADIENNPLYRSMQPALLPYVEQVENMYNVHAKMVAHSIMTAHAQGTQN